MKAGNEGRSATLATRRRRAVRNSWLLLGLLLALTAVGYFAAKRIVDLHEAERFADGAEQSRSLISGRVGEYVDAVYAAGAVLSPSPSGEPLEELYSALRRGGRLPALIGFVHAELPREGRGGRIVSLAPAPSLAPLVDQDLLANPDLRESVSLAVRTGAAVASRTVVEAPSGLASLWIVVPLAPGPTGRERFVGALLDVDELMHDTLRGAVGAVFDVEVYASEAPTLESLLYDEDGFPDAIAQAPFAEAQTRLGFHPAGREWTLFFSKRPGFALVGTERQVPLVVLVSGLLLSGGLFAFSFFQVRGRFRAEALADELRASREKILQREAETETQRKRSALLAEASRLLSSSTDVNLPLQALPALTVPFLADWCAIDLCADGSGSKRAAARHRDDALTEVLVGMSELHPPSADGPGAIDRALRGEPTVGEGIPAFLGPVQDRVRDRVEVLRLVGLGPFVTQPIALREQVFGSLCLGRTEGAPPFSSEEQTLAADLANRMALALENARLHHKLVAAVALRDEFLSVASHELKTPLTPTMLRLQQLQHRARGTSLEGPLGQALASLRRLSRLIAELLDVSRISAGRMSLELRETNLTALVFEVAERLRPEFEKAGCRLVVDAAPAATGRWDALRLEQVIVNLCTNAIRYAPGSLVTVRLEQSPDRVRLSVEDEGMGIAPEDLDRIFERFERAVPSRHYGGLGLGLYIVRQIVGAMGGTVGVKSHLGHGATFIVELPRSGPGAEISKPVEPSAPEEAHAPGGAP